MEAVRGSKCFYSMQKKLTGFAPVQADKSDIFPFFSEGTLCLVLCVFSVLQNTKMSQAESSCNTGMSDLLQQVWKKRNVIYYSLFISATITLQNPKENNVIEVTCLLPCRNLKQPQARANTDVVQGIKRVLDAVASNYPGI